jgi:hypothetical protein
MAVRFRTDDCDRAFRAALETRAMQLLPSWLRLQIATTRRIRPPPTLSALPPLRFGRARQDDSMSGGGQPTRFYSPWLCAPSDSGVLCRVCCLLYYTEPVRKQGSYLL